MVFKNQPVKFVYVCVYVVKCIKLRQIILILCSLNIILVRQTFSSITSTIFGTMIPNSDSIVPTIAISIPA